VNGYSEPFPLYAPELNPVDRVWGYVKYNRTPNFAPPDLGILRDTLTVEFDRAASKPDLQVYRTIHASIPCKTCSR
jgi:transposase